MPFFASRWRVLGLSAFWFFAFSSREPPSSRLLAPPSAAPSLRWSAGGEAGPSVPGVFCFPESSTSSEAAELEAAAAAAGSVSRKALASPGVVDESRYLFGPLSEASGLVQEELRLRSRDGAEGLNSAAWEVAGARASPRSTEEDLPSSGGLTGVGSSSLANRSVTTSPAAGGGLTLQGVSTAASLDGGDKALCDAEAALKAQLIRAEQHLQGLSSDVSLIRRSVQELYVATEEDSERHPNQRLLEMLDSSVRTLPERLSLYAQGNATEFATQLEDATAAKLMALYQEYLSSSLKTASLFSDFSALTASLRDLESQTDVTAGDHLDKLRVWGASKSAMFREALQESQAKLLQSFAENKHKEQTRVNFAVLEEMHVKAAALGASAMLEERGFGVVDLSECCAGFDARRVGQLLLHEVLKVKARRLKVIPILVATKPPPAEPVRPPPSPLIPQIEMRGSGGVRRATADDAQAAPGAPAAAADEPKVPLMDKVADFRKLALAVTDELMAARMEVLEKVLPSTAKASLKARLSRLRASKAREKAREHLSPLPHATWGGRSQRRSILPPLFTLQQLVRDVHRLPASRVAEAAAAPDAYQSVFSGAATPALSSAASAAAAYPLLLVSVEGALVEAFRVDRVSAASVPVQYPPPHVPLGAPVPHSSYGVSLEKAFLFVRPEDVGDPRAAPSAYAFRAEFPSPCDDAPLAAERSAAAEGPSDSGREDAPPQRPQPQPATAALLPQAFNPFEKCVRARSSPSRRRAARRAASEAEAAESPARTETESASDGAALAEEAKRAAPAADWTEASPASLHFHSGGEGAALGASGVFALFEKSLEAEDRRAGAETEAGGVEVQETRRGFTRRRLNAATSDALLLSEVAGATDATKDSALKTLHPKLFELHNDRPHRSAAAAERSSSSSGEVEGGALYEGLQLQHWEKSLEAAAGGLLGPDDALSLPSQKEPSSAVGAEEHAFLFGESASGEAENPRTREAFAADIGGLADLRRRRESEGERERDEEFEEEVVLLAYVGSRALGLPLLSEGHDGGRAAEQRRLLLQQSAWQLQRRLAMRSGGDDERADELDVRAELLAMRREVRLLQPRSWASHSVTKHIPAIDVSLSVAFGSAPTLLLPLTPFFQRSVLLVRLHVRRCDGGLFSAPPATALKRALMLASYPGGAHGAALHCLQRILSASNGAAASSSRRAGSVVEEGGLNAAAEPSPDEADEDALLLQRYDSAETHVPQPTGEAQTQQTPQTPGAPHGAAHAGCGQGNEETSQPTSARQAQPRRPFAASLPEELSAGEPLEWVVQSWALHNGAAEESQVVVHAAVSGDSTQLYVQPGTVGTLSWLLQKANASSGVGREKDAGCRSARGFFAGAVPHSTATCLSPRQLVNAVFANMAAGAVPDLFQPALRGRLVVVAISPEESGAPGEASLAVELLAVAEARDAARRRATRKAQRGPAKQRAKTEAA